MKKRNVKEVIQSLFSHRSAVLATMHKKEQVMAPILEEHLGLNLFVPKNFNTDKFGTFTREIDRLGSQVEAARKKVEEALLLTGESLGLSSEGSFGPHPNFPFQPFNREIVFLLDQKHDLAVYGEAYSIKTNYKHQTIKSLEEALEFCQDVQFPQHAVIVKTSTTTKDSHAIIKGIRTTKKLKEAVTYMLTQSIDHDVVIESDMRALYNPTRMSIIKLATDNLIQKLYSLCPICSSPGFQVVKRREGLQCRVCGTPTKRIYSEIYQCSKCNAEEECLYPDGQQKADPLYCPFCNP